MLKVVAEETRPWPSRFEASIRLERRYSDSGRDFADASAILVVATVTIARYRLITR